MFRLTSAKQAEHEIYRLTPVKLFEAKWTFDFQLCCEGSERRDVNTEIETV